MTVELSHEEVVAELVLLAGRFERQNKARHSRVCRQAVELLVKAKVAEEALAGRRKSESTRQKKRRKRDATTEGACHVTSRDKAGCHVTDVTPFFPPRPPFSPSTHTHTLGESEFLPRLEERPSTTSGRALASSSHDDRSAVAQTTYHGLRATFGPEGWLEVRDFLRSRGNKRLQWAKAIAGYLAGGPWTPADVLAVIRDDKLAARPIDSPLGFRAFLNKAKSEREAITATATQNGSAPRRSSTAREDPVEKMEAARAWAREQDRREAVESAARAAVGAHE
jgi:hypothetical protein